MQFEANGTFIKRGKSGKFNKLMEAANEKMATEKLYAEMGSKQGLRRGHIHIEEIKVKK